MTWKMFQDKYEFASGMVGVIIVIAIALFVLFIFDTLNIGSSNGDYIDPSLYPYVTNLEDY